VAAIVPPDAAKTVPTTAILAVGKTIDTPQALDGQIVIRPMLKLTLAVDHRVSDGGPRGSIPHRLQKYPGESLFAGLSRW